MRSGTRFLETNDETARSKVRSQAKRRKIQPSFFERISVKLRAELTPASVLLNSARAEVFFVLEPEAKPFNGLLLRHHAIPRFHEDVCAVRKIGQVHRFIQT